MRAVVAAVFVAVLGLLGLLGAGLVRQQGSGAGGFGINAVGRVADLKVRPAPDFSLHLFDGQLLRLTDQRNTVVVLNFWASWCPPCREEAPLLARAAERYRDRGVLFVGVDIWDAEGDAEEFVKQYNVRYPNGLDKSGTIAIEYGVTGIPETFVVDRNGTLVRRWIGPVTEAELGDLLDEYAT